MPREQRQQVVEPDRLRSPPLAETPTGNADNPVGVGVLNPSKSKANLFFQKEIMSPKISYFDSSRSVQAVHLEQVVAEAGPNPPELTFTCTQPESEESRPASAT
jgi:hypothetical protein